MNTIARLRCGVEAGFDRLEIDLHHRRGRFLLSHDLPVGPVAIGPIGVEFPRSPFNVVQWQGTFLELPSVLGAKPPPLYIDLKGPWPEEALRALSRELCDQGRGSDLVASNHWIHAERMRRIAPERRFVFGVSTRTFPQLTRYLDSGRTAFGVSVAARAVRSRGPAFVERLHAAGVAVFVWDVRERALLAELGRLGVEGVIVDDPSWSAGPK